MSPRMTDVANVMRALADPTRRTVFEQLVQAGELTVASLTEHNQVSQPAISQHLKALREAGLVVERREGRHAYYRCEPQGLEPLADWLGVFWRSRFNGLRHVLEEMDDEPPSKPRPARHRR
jgi:DNA-binding transcriptional ArsR family regulator